MVMSQRLNYAALPNTPDKAYLAVINKVIGHVGRTPAQFKVFREWLREQQLWDRDQTPIALELMGVQTKPEVGLTELGVHCLMPKTIWPKSARYSGDFGIEIRF
jgi:hypothetical protein